MLERQADQPLPPLRLLFVADSLNMGGAERHVVDLASTLVQQGHTVTLACSIDGALAYQAEQARVTVLPLMQHLVKRRLSPTLVWKLTKLIHQGQFDLVHAHMYASVVASACATLATGLPLVVTEHSQATWRSHRGRLLSRWSYRRAGHIIAVSQEIRRRLIEQDGVASERVSVVMNALSPLLELSSSSRADLPAGIGNAPLVGVVARLQAEKGVVYFLEAAAHILRILPHIHFLIIGDGPLRKELQAYAEQLGVQKRVHFLGFRLDARALIAALDVLVIPSLSEGTPLVTLEAFSAGVPVVASAVGGIPEQVRHQCEGLLVPAGNAPVLAEAVLHLLQNPGRMQQMGEAGRQRALSQFRFSTMVRETENIYRKVLDWQTYVDNTDSREPDQLLAGTGRYKV
ncbi:MAG: glycosyltransferase family 4 protein [Ktedonobacteraceae bacterium]